MIAKLKDESPPLICCFCGARTGNDPIWMKQAEVAGRKLSEAGFGIVYGGGTVGMMGRLADEVAVSGGRVVGVLPEFLKHQEAEGEARASTIFTQSMHERKNTMYQLASGFLAMPGGIGTFDELCETIAWLKIGIHDAPLYIWNIHHFFDPFIQLIDNLKHHGFLNDDDMTKVKIVDDIDTIVSSLKEAISIHK
ncbi:hypothetical protein SAMN04487866_11413 [Thermoactinomyces sp. DSM 45891]|uniref:LOG family protein n=1 Tax=Thermoactinomyces sp. DSM 45891 TaxID=1761907 RepID=UPI00091C384F|nr:TIGR00730 family Rossman fold protein [Thermoactinomyces sp. DSM 45891]SFX61798.1 hypothetical protein SAMN04487866_11413 [Thermoactinomyces sp. DSM 45891]